MKTISISQRSSEGSEDRANGAQAMLTLKEQFINNIV